MTEAEEGEWKRAQVQRMRRTASDSRKHDTTATKAMTEYKKANPKAGQGVLKQVHDAKLKELKAAATAIAPCVPVTKAMRWEQNPATSTQSMLW